MTRTKALMDFFKAAPNSFHPKMQEMKDFKTACSSEEWEQFSNDAAAFLGTTITK